MVRPAKLVVKMLIFEKSARVVADVSQYLAITKVSLAKHFLVLKAVLIVIHPKNVTSVFLTFTSSTMVTAKANVQKDTSVNNLATPANAVLMIALLARECMFVIAAVQILIIDS